MERLFKPDPYPRVNGGWSIPRMSGESQNLAGNSKHFLVRELLKTIIQNQRSHK